MWAFALYDIVRNEDLILCRDRFGEKPLTVFYKEKNNFFFGSELACISNFFEG